jgi:hypothetical protein
MLQLEVHGVSVPAISLRSPSVHLKGPELKRAPGSALSRRPLLRPPYG